MTTVAVPLKDKTTYHGLYRIKVDHLPLLVVARLVSTFVFGGLVTASVLAHWPVWLTAIFIYCAASTVLGLIATTVRLVVQASR